MHQDSHELDRFKREVHFVEYATTRYGYQLDRRESSRNSVVLRHAASDDKLIVSRSAQDGHWTYFSVRDHRDNGSIVDFIQRRGNRNLGDVRSELRHWLGTPRPELPPDNPVRRDVTPIPRDRESLLRVLASAENVATSPYLNRRGLRPETLNDPRFAATWKQDARGNVLFIHRDSAGVSGFESKNHGFTGFSAGGTKAVWHSQPKPTDSKLVITESAIDALSYHQLHRAQNPSTRYVSLGGAPSHYQLGAHRPSDPETAEGQHHCRRCRR